jgi:hypothetical protein
MHLFNSCCRRHGGARLELSPSRREAGPVAIIGEAGVVAINSEAGAGAVAINEARAVAVVNEAGAVAVVNEAGVAINEAGAIAINKAGAVSAKVWLEAGAVAIDEAGAVAINEAGAVAINEAGAVAETEAGAVAINEAGLVAIEEAGAVGAAQRLELSVRLIDGEAASQLCIEQLLGDLHCWIALGSLEGQRRGMGKVHWSHDCVGESGVKRPLSDAKALGLTLCMRSSCIVKQLDLIRADRHNHKACETKRIEQSSYVTCRCYLLSHGLARMVGR